MIDAHHHLWRIDRGDYSWMDDSVAAIRRDFLLPDLAAVTGPACIAGTVIVQAAPTLEETEFLLSLADASTTPEILGVVGWVDLEGDVEAQLDRLQHPKLKGIRPMLQDIEDTGWILSPDVMAGLETVARRGLALDALITPRHLEVLAHVAARLPRLRIVIDHCAKPVFAGSDPGEVWRTGMVRLSALPQMHCKLSGLANEFGPRWSEAGLRPVCRHVLEQFGPERVMWGSDWPVLDLAGSYADWFTAARALTARLPEAARESVFGGTATRFYQLGEGA
ncbi:MAG: amidohydrolase family protein [Rhodobacteraceae bacterium]|nr:amidohydrolase family protein [Paracoccaceae bacterium]